MKAWIETVTPPQLLPVVVDHQNLLEELLHYARLRPSGVIIPWAVVLLDNPSLSTARLAELISFDAVLASRALGFANTPHVVMQSLITNIDEALMRLGLEKARGFVLSSTLPYLHSHESSEGQGGTNEHGWVRAIARALLAREITKALRFATADDVYTCALVTSNVEEMQRQLPPMLDNKLEEVGDIAQPLLAIALGLVECWPSEWICVAVEQCIEQCVEQRDEQRVQRNSPLSHTLFLAQEVSSFLCEERSLQLEEHAEIQKTAEALSLSEVSLQKILVSARKALTTSCAQFGVSVS